MKRTLLNLAAATALTLAGCKEQSEVKAPAASGEVLPGTVSDAMLDTDQSQAQAPVMAVHQSGSAPADEGGAVLAADASTDATAVDAPEPVASATASPEAKSSAGPSVKPLPKAPATAKPKPTASAT